MAKSEYHNTLDYYRKEYVRIFTSIENPNWRIWKIVDYDNRVIQSKHPTTNPESLWKFVKQAENPKALYVSVSTFLSPETNHGAFYRQNFKLGDGTHMFPREGYILTDSILLDTFLFIDIDSEENLEIAQEDGRKIIKYMGTKPEYELSMLQFSATKGIHIGYKLLNKPSIRDPIKRIEYYKGIKGAWAKELLKLGLKTIDRHHIEIIKNNFCVFAAPYSIKKNGNIVTPLDKEEFMSKGIYDILRHSKRLITKASEAPKGADDEEVAANAEGNTSAQQYRVGGRFSGLSSQPTSFKFIDNMVNGLRNTYVTVIKKHSRRFNVNDLRKLQRRKNLSDFIVMKIGDYVYAYNLKIMDFEGEVKILRKAKSENLSFFVTRRHCPIQISDSVDQYGKTETSINFIGILKSKYGMHDNHSRPHSKLFGMDYENLVGNESNNVGTMRVS